MTAGTRRIGAMTLAAVAVMLVVWYLALFRPQAAHLRAAHAAYDQATAQAAQLQDRVTSLRALEKQIPADRSELAALGVSLPHSADLQDALSQFHALATGSGVTLTAVNPAADVGSANGQATGGIKTVRLSLSLTGPYAQTMSFLSGLDTMARTVVVDSASFSPSAGGALTTSLSTRIFYTP